MATTLADRIRIRMEEMGTNPTALARLIGRDKDFIRQLLKGRKRTISSDALGELARVFGCETNDLLGTTRSDIVEGASEIVLNGTIEAETWRRPQDDALRGNTIPMAIHADPHLEGVQFYMFQGNANEAGICHGALLTIVALNAPLRHGQFVVVERSMGDLMERSVRRVEMVAAGNASIRLLPLDGARTSQPLLANESDVEIVGSVASATHFY